MSPARMPSRCPIARARSSFEMRDDGKNSTGRPAAAANCSAWASPIPSRRVTTRRYAGRNSKTVTSGRTLNRTWSRWPTPRLM